MLVSLVALVPFLQTGSASAAELTPQISEPSVVDVAFDAAGNLYESEDNGNVNVWPTASGTIFGKAVTPGQANTLVTVNNTPGIAFDSAGDLFISNDNGASGGSISVLPATSTTIFGQSVTANTLTTLVTGLDNPIGLAFDASGNLYYATQNAISVLPVASGIIFGQSVTADRSAALITGVTQGGFLALDSAGDLFYSDVGNQMAGAATVNVLPQATGSIFGTAVTANTPATLVSGLTDALGLALDTDGILYVDYYGTVAALSSTTTTLDGTSVPANTLTTLGVGMLGDLGATFYNGHVYIADQVMDSVDQLTTPTASISGITFGGSAANPIMIVKGTNFATSWPTFSIGCSGTGSDYKYGNLFLSDATNGWGAGVPGDCIGLTVGKQKSTTVGFGLGSFYSPGFELNAGEAFSVGVDGTTFSGTVSYAPPSGATVTNVSPNTGPGGGGTAVTITGTGLERDEIRVLRFVPGDACRGRLGDPGDRSVAEWQPDGGRDRRHHHGRSEHSRDDGPLRVPGTHDHEYQPHQGLDRRREDRHDHRDEPRGGDQGLVRVLSRVENHGELGNADHRGDAGGERRDRASHGHGSGRDQQRGQLQVQGPCLGSSHASPCRTFATSASRVPGHALFNLVGSVGPKIRVRVTERSRSVNPGPIAFLVHYSMSCGCVVRRWHLRVTLATGSDSVLTSSRPDPPKLETNATRFSFTADFDHDHAQEARRSSARPGVPRDALLRRVPWRMPPRRYRRRPQTHHKPALGTYVAATTPPTALKASLGGAVKFAMDFQSGASWSSITQSTWPYPKWHGSGY